MNKCLSYAFFVCNVYIECYKCLSYCLWLFFDKKICTNLPFNSERNQYNSFLACIRHMIQGNEKKTVDDIFRYHMAKC